MTREKGIKKGRLWYHWEQPRCATILCIWGRDISLKISMSKTKLMNMKTRQERMKKDYGMIGSSQGVSLKMWTKTLSKCDMLLWLWEQIRSKASEKIKKQLKIIPSVFLVCCDGTLDVCLMREVYMCVSYEGYTCVSYERWGAQVPYCTNCTGIRVVGDLTHRLKWISFL